MLTAPPPASRRDRHLDVRGARLRYRDAGHGPPVLLIHGWALDLDMWEPQLASLSRRFRVVAVDRPGFGRSTGSGSLARDVADLRTLCRAANEVLSQAAGLDFAANSASGCCG